jgi:hypothetical protein
MDVAALIVWIVTALGGFVLLGTWFTKRNTDTNEPSRIGPGLVLSHFALAALGLVLWLVYVLASDVGALPTVALLILLAVAALGFTMFARWLADRRRDPVPDRPEQRFPVAVVGLHGLAGAVTLGLVAWVALGR